MGHEVSVYEGPVFTARGSGCRRNCRMDRAGCQGGDACAVSQAHWAIPGGRDRVAAARTRDRTAAAGANAGEDAGLHARGSGAHGRGARRQRRCSGNAARSRFLRLPLHLATSRDLFLGCSPRPSLFVRRLSRWPVHGPAPAWAWSSRAAVGRERNGDSRVTRVENVPEACVDEVRALGYRATAKEPDYLYDASALSDLSGESFKSPRAACNRFIRERGGMLEPYEPRDERACVSLFHEWRDIVGLGPFVFREFCRQARAKGACWINTMDDSGLPSLARSKQWYHPARLLPNYIVTES